MFLCVNGIVPAILRCLDCVNFVVVLAHQHLFLLRVDASCFHTRQIAHTRNNAPQQYTLVHALNTAYYYPTAKKRYLPRIQKVSAQIGTIPDAIAEENWAAVAEFGATAENAILPLQLYQSSLDGQGLSMSSSYAKNMKADALQYERAYKVFNKAVQQKNGDLALQALSDMGVAIADYRQMGRLSDDDGNIPSVDEMRRMAMRRQTGQYNQYDKN